MSKLKLFRFVERAHMGKPKKVNKEEGILEGIKILGLESKNGRTYKHEALVEAKHLYEGAKVNVNHSSEGARLRDARDRIGKFQGIRVESDGLYGDLHFLTTHPMAPMLIEAAERMPEIMGFSHDATGKGVMGPNGLVIEKIVNVASVDLVADPATNASLFESEEIKPGTKEETIVQEDNGEEDELKITDLTLEQIKKERPELIAALEAEQATSEEAKKLKEEHTADKKKLDEYRAKEALQKINDAVEKELEEAKLAEPLVTDTFKETLARCKDATQRKELIDERKELAKGAAFKKKPTTKRVPESSGPEGDGTYQEEDFSHLGEAEYGKHILGLTGRMPLPVNGGN